MRLSGSDCQHSISDASDSPASILVLMKSSLRRYESRDKPALRLCSRDANSNRREQKQQGDLRYLERRLRPSVAEVIRERRRRRLAAEGRLFEERRMQEHLHAGNQPRTIAETIRAGRPAATK